MAVQEEAWEPEQHLRPPRVRRRSLGLLAAPVFLALAALLIAGYQYTLVSLTVVADGQMRTVRTHQTTVEAVLREAGLAIYPEDIVEPGLKEGVYSGATVAVRRARPVVVEVEGSVLQARTQLSQMHDILAQMGIHVGQYDQVRTVSDGRASEAQDSPIHIQVDRAERITVYEADSPPRQLYTTTPTVGRALYEAGIVLFLADGVRPSLSSPIEPGTRVYIDRSVPVTILVDDQTLRTRTHRLTVGDVLADAGISLQGLDYAEPDLDIPLDEGREIRVVRVQEELLVQQEPIPFESHWAPDPELEIDHQQMGQPGEAGVFERRIRVRYENSVEVARWIEAEWVAKAPRAKILNYGTKIVLRTIDTASGPAQYWRKYRMLATSYNAASSGKPPDHPRYGITRMGLQMRRGIVAVDPRVIRLGSQVFVPGYGVGLAADTGGAIRNLRIDLGYDDDNLVSWYRCVEVYVLTPVPDNVEYVVSSLVHPRCR